MVTKKQLQKQRRDRAQYLLEAQQAKARQTLDRAYWLSKMQKDHTDVSSITEGDKKLLALNGAGILITESSPSVIAHDAAGENCSFLSLFGVGTISSLLALETDDQQLVIDSAEVEFRYHFEESVGTPEIPQFLGIELWADAAATIALAATPVATIEALIDASVSGGKYSYQTSPVALKEWLYPITIQVESELQAFILHYYSQKYDFGPICQKFLDKRRKAISAGETGGPAFLMGLIKVLPGHTGGNPVVAYEDGISNVLVSYHLTNRKKQTL